MGTVTDADSESGLPHSVKSWCDDHSQLQSLTFLHKMSERVENVTLAFPRYSSGQDTRQPVIVYTSLSTELPANHILLRVDRFGFSANNITYQVLGEAPHFRYYDYHPAPVADGVRVSPETHGLVPVWGFGTVVKSTHSGVHVGERVYGYLAPARYLAIPVSPSDVNKYAFYVPRPHLPADRRPYNQLLRCATDTQYDESPEGEDLTMLYRPLFWTSYWCEDWLFKTGYRGANKILISSASSKTAFCLAYLIGKRVSRGEIFSKKVVGLTSKRNMAFTIGLGLYGDVVDYESFTSATCLQVSNQDKWIYFDFSGNETLNKRLFAHFGSDHHLVASIAIGMTNLSPSLPNVPSTNWKLNTFAGDKDTPSKSSAVTDTKRVPLEQFFMVEWLNVRKHQLTPKEIHTMQEGAWKDLMKDCVGWVKLERVFGEQAVKETYQRLVEEGIGPAQGFIWSLWDNNTLAVFHPKL